jgi:hypothetical protein
VRDSNGGGSGRLGSGLPVFGQVLAMLDAIMEVDRRDNDKEDGANARVSVGERTVARRTLLLRTFIVAVIV